MKSQCGSSDWVEKHTAWSVVFGGVCHSDVALLSPSCTPGVSDDPVALGAFFAVADDSNGMIKSVEAAWAISWVENT